MSGMDGSTAPRLSRAMSRRALLQRAAVLGLATPLATAALAACGGPASSAGTATGTGSAGSPAAGGTVTLTGAGSSFDYPLFTRAFAEYARLHPEVRVNYQSVGSGAGIQQLTQGTVDFGATDAPMTDQQIQAAGGGVVHVPVTLGAVAVAYNLPGVAEGLKLTGPVLADIYLGAITRWRDPRIAALNPDLALPDAEIVVVHRSDGSGTSDIFTSYLASVSPEWKQRVGSGLAVNWPVGIGGKGSEGVAGQVKQLAGSIGYFELAYARQNGLTVAAIESAGGRFLLPAPESATACAASAAASLPADLRVRIAGCAGSEAYPISGFSWVVLRGEQPDAARGRALVAVLWWLIHDGQRYASDLAYAPLPPEVVRRAEQQLRSVTAGGASLAPAS